MISVMLAWRRRAYLTKRSASLNIPDTAQCTPLPNSYIFSMLVEGEVLMPMRMTPSVHANPTMVPASLTPFMAYSVCSRRPSSVKMFDLARDSSILGLENPEKQVPGREYKDLNSQRPENQDRHKKVLEEQ